MMRWRRAAQRERLAMNEQHPTTSQPRPQRPRIRRATLGILGCMLAAALILAVATRLSLRDFPDSLDTLTEIGRAHV